MLRDLKYLLAYTIPLVTIFAFRYDGWWTFATVIYAFGCIPLLEIVLDQRDETYDATAKEARLNNILFDLLLYVNIPFVIGLTLYGISDLVTTTATPAEQLGRVLSLGILLATNGINVAHELGHRMTTPERYLAKLLLCPSLYMHFYIEHNFGHHKNVATPEDPASAKKQQTVYGFWITSIVGQYRNAWRIQQQLLRQQQKSFFSPKNDMFYYTLFQLGYLALLGGLFGLVAVGFGSAVAMVSVLMLETINYIEHYGLQRKMRDNGRYERVLPEHSWNSNHIVGRLVLYELTRHSDHHHRANKKYQILENKTESPQLPWGYPTSMLVAMVPPLWFSVMNPRLERFNSGQAA